MYHILGIFWPWFIIGLICHLYEKAKNKHTKKLFCLQTAVLWLHPMSVCSVLTKKPPCNVSISWITNILSSKLGNTCATSVLFKAKSWHCSNIWYHFRFVLYAGIFIFNLNSDTWFTILGTVLLLMLPRVLCLL